MEMADSGCSSCGGDSIQYQEMPSGSSSQGFSSGSSTQSVPSGSSTQSVPSGSSSRGVIESPAVSEPIVPAEASDVYRADDSKDQS